MSRLEVLRSYSHEDIDQFRRTMRSDVIPPEMQDYIIKLDAAIILARQAGLGVRKAIKALSSQFAGMTYKQALTVYYDALEFFCYDENVSAHAWDLYYAEQFETLMQQALKSQRFETAYRCMCKAHELRTNVRESEGVEWHAPVFQINTELKPEALGYKSRKLADIARRQEDAKIKEMIMGLSTTDAEKQRMLSEAGVDRGNFYDDAEEQ